MTIQAVTIQARTTRLPEPPDLLAEAGDDGLLFRDEHGGLAGRGVAMRIELPDGLSDPERFAQVTEILRAIPTRDPIGRPGTGPVAIGALAFDPSVPGHLVVPAVVYGRAGDEGWVTKISGSSPPAAVRGGEPPDEFSLTPTMTHAEWRDLVAETVAVLERGEMAKVVLARRIDIAANRPFVVSDVLERLVALYPSCSVFSIDGFLGASPELLIARRGDRVESHPLAGTVARSGDAHGDEELVARLMSSAKNRREHQVVVDTITSGLAPYCDHLDVPAEPSVMGLRNVSHLATHITGRLIAGKLGERPPSALELVAAIHPTPAVGGNPAEAAVRYLQKVEGFDRGPYTGPVGWMDARGDGTWMLGIRCGEVAGATARIYAGNGIVAGSDPVDELAETQLKLQALLAALVRP
ncbi:MAG: isochorismate synthase [Acidimicrobiales bacterium]|nr:isochorismate synthase [Acidimicrobiales bacterium]